MEAIVEKKFSLGPFVGTFCDGHCKQLTWQTVKHGPPERPFQLRFLLVIPQGGGNIISKALGIF